MAKPSPYAAFLAIALAALPVAVQAHPIVTETKPAASGFMTAQYPPGSERCHWLRHRARELEYRVAYAPPWERERLNFRLAGVRHELWESCRR